MDSWKGEIPKKDYYQYKVKALYDNQDINRILIYHQLIFCNILAVVIYDDAIEIELILE